MSSGEFFAFTPCGAVIVQRGFWPVRVCRSSISRFLEAQKLLKEARDSFFFNSNFSLACLDQATRIMPDEPRFFNELGVMLAHLGQYQLALEKIGRAIELAPEVFFLYLSKAALYVSLGETAGNYTEPDLCLQAHVLERSDRDLGFSYFWGAMLALKREQFALAIYCLEEAIKKDSDMAYEVYLWQLLEFLAGVAEKKNLGKTGESTKIILAQA